MYGLYCCKNKFYSISKRNYLEDYGFKEPKKIDMTLSGTYLSKYPFITNIKNYRLDKYPNIKEINILINNIRKKFEFYNDDYSVILGAGTNGLIQNICKILIKNEDNIITPYLSFEQAEYATTSYGGETKRVYLDDNFNINFENIEKSIDERTKCIYICNPNNPTGIIIENNKILNFAKKYPDIYIIIDESNIEFSSSKSLLNENNIYPNLIILKSFSKAYGLSNLRIGYLVCSKEFHELYKERITINEFSGISCYYANKVICSKAYIDNVKKVNKEIKYLKKELEKVNIKTINTNSNTLFTEDNFKNEFLEILSKHNISVVIVTDQNNKIHLRIACQSHKINKQFINELKKIDNIKQYIL